MRLIYTACNARYIVTYIFNFVYQLHFLHNIKNKKEGKHKFHEPAHHFKILFYVFQFSFYLFFFCVSFSFVLFSSNNFALLLWCQKKSFFSFRNWLIDVIEVSHSHTKINYNIHINNVCHAARQSKPYAFKQKVN